MIFYLGTHMPHWLGVTAVPLMVSHRTLTRRRTLPRALGPWVCDSGGFTELSMHGTWTVPAAEYVQAVRRYRDEIASMMWAAPQDWMCEPVITAKTGLTVGDHQRRTVANFLQLRSLAPDLPIIPVIQGWDRDDYLRCVDLYDHAGVDLTAEPTVGIGSVCRRQSTSEIGVIVRQLSSSGLRLHGFGVKQRGLFRYGDALTSADSLAWSFTARRDHPLPGCPHRSCANCLRYALRWRARILSHQQLAFDLEEPA